MIQMSCGKLMGRPELDNSHPKARLISNCISSFDVRALIEAYLPKAHTQFKRGGGGGGIRYRVNEPG